MPYAGFIFLPRSGTFESGTIKLYIKVIMAIIRANNNTLSSVTALPDAISTGGFGSFIWCFKFKCCSS